MAIEYEVVHAIPGRVRVRVPALQRVEGLAEACSSLLAQQDGITGVRHNRTCGSIIINYEPSLTDLPQRLAGALDGMSPEMILSLHSAQQTSGGVKYSNGFENNQPLTGGRSALGALALPTTSLALTLAGGPLAALALPIIGYNAIPTFKRAYDVLSRERRLNVDFLDSLAIALSTLQGSFFTGAFITWLINLGDLIRDHTAAKSRRAIGDLLDYEKRKAWVMRGEKKIEVAVSNIKAGDTVIVYAGGMIPVDGEVIKGRAEVDQKTITGESLMVLRRTGDKVYAATVVSEGKIYLRAERVGAETTAAQIVRLVEAAPVGETRIQNYAEKFADKLVAPSLALAGGLYAVTADLNRLLSMVIIDLGTGIRVAAPTSVLAAMTHAARQGILIKGGSSMEKLNQVDTILFDKTGTLTCGLPRVQAITSYDERRFPPRKILSLAAAAEARLKHPVALAILNKAREERVNIPEREDSTYRIGRGVEIAVNGYFVQVGSERFLREKAIKLDRASEDLKRLNRRGYSALLLSVDGQLKGLIPYADLVRPESSMVVTALRERGVRHLSMLTGDNGTVAAAVAAELGIDEFYPEILPAEKADIVQRLRQSGRVVAMVGDGINDSPALSHADVGIALKNGADVTREAADLVLMEENLWKLVSAVDISREAIGLVRQNFALIAGMNAFAFALSIPTGIVSPGFTALVSNGSAILATLNATRPILRY
jgi:heavy metal translocating P-type ATPase